jgi:hypothetical protein
MDPPKFKELMKMINFFVVDPGESLLTGTPTREEDQFQSGTNGIPNWASET